MKLRLAFDRSWLDAFATGVRLRKLFQGGFFGSWHEHFDRLQARGVHLMPVHYYSPVPDTAALPESTWEAESPMTGVTVDVPRALGLARRLATAYAAEFAAFADDRTDPHRFHLKNGSYSYMEAVVLYGMLRDLKPKAMVEVGSGNTTLLTAHALHANATADPPARCDFVAVEPYPQDFLLGDFPAKPRLLRQRLEDVPLDVFDALGKDDVLFIDSSHVLKIGSDVRREYLDILPRLKSGVVVHVHDIFFPYEYPESWVRRHHYFWNEQYLLQAFLAFNDQFEVLCPTYWLYRKHAADLADAFPRMNDGHSPPASFWMRRR